MNAYELEQTVLDLMVRLTRAEGALKAHLEGKQEMHQEPTPKDPGGVTD